MLKLVMTDSYDHGMEPVSIVDLFGRGVDRSWMQKRAAALTKEFSDIRPEKNKTALHVIAMGATESTGPNRNADGWREKELMRKHGTFVTNGHVYKNHQNTDPAKASGVIKASAYNEPMRRVELLISVDNDKWAPELEKLASGKDLALSMACKVAYDQCSVCGNKAPSRADYCPCMQKFAGQVLDDGRLVYVDNPDPLFFDISGVMRPADRTAYCLRKAASATVMTGAELAEEAGMVAPLIDARRLYKISTCRQAKRDTLKKLSTIEKKTEGMAPAELQRLARGFKSKAVDYDTKVAQDVSQHLDHAMALLADLRVCLPVHDFMKLALEDRFDVDPADVQACLPGIFTKLAQDEELVQDGSYDAVAQGPSRISAQTKQVFMKAAQDLSLDELAFSQRAALSVAKGFSTPVLNMGSGIFRMKAAADAQSAAVVAREYAKYKLAFLTKAAEHGDSELLLRLGVLQNYVQA
jgi:hypothetical protein